MTHSHLNSMVTWIIIRKVPWWTNRKHFVEGNLFDEYINIVKIQWEKTCVLKEKKTI
jgi:hypothetical protein